MNETQKLTFPLIRRTPQAVLDLYRKLTGKEPTQAEKDEIQAKYDAHLKGDHT